MRAWLRGLKVTVMGLGLNGGGIEATRFLVKCGAEVTVTDLRDETVLAPSLAALEGLRFRAVLGTHEEADFLNADIVIKNPAVRPGNKYIALAKRIETDLSLFFSLVSNPIIAVTGSKGKSTTASAIYHVLSRSDPSVRIGGNITISPLSFIDDLNETSPVVMELSSFQLGDLSRATSVAQGKGLSAFPPRISIVTSLFHDHQDYYGNMESYLADKEVIFARQRPDQFSIFNVDNPFGKDFANRSPSQVWRVSRNEDSGNRHLWLGADGDFADPFSGPQGFMRDDSGDTVQVVPERLSIVGRHHRVNLLQAACALSISGIRPDDINKGLNDFKGVEHRLETVIVHNGVTYINDSAATIPEAALGAVTSLGSPIHLITGGTDKALDFAPYAKIGRSVVSISLLEGSASVRIAEILKREKRQFFGPYDDIDRCVAETASRAKPGDIVILSPGCASFGLFLNEFDRGRKYKAAVMKHIS